MYSNAENHLGVIREARHTLVAPPSPHLHATDCPPLAEAFHNILLLRSLACSRRSGQVTDVPHVDDQAHGYSDEGKNSYSHSEEVLPCMLDLKSKPMQFLRSRLVCRFPVFFLLFLHLMGFVVRNLSVRFWNVIILVQVLPYLSRDSQLYPIKDPYYFAQ